MGSGARWLGRNDVTIFMPLSGGFKHKLSRARPALLVAAMLASLRDTSYWRVSIGNERRRAWRLIPAVGAGLIEELREGARLHVKRHELLPSCCGVNAPRFGTPIIPLRRRRVSTGVLSAVAPRPSSSAVGAPSEQETK